MAITVASRRVGLDADRRRGRCRGLAAPDRRGHAHERVSASRPSRTGSPCAPEGGARRGPSRATSMSREPRDQQGAVPVQRAAPTAANGENDFDNAQVSRLILDQRSAGVLNGSFAIPSSSGFQRFCSNYLATSKEGFSRDILSRTRSLPTTCSGRRTPGRPPIGDPAEREAGARGRARRQDRPTTTRSTGWAGTTTRTTSRSRGMGNRSSSRVTTRSRAVPLTGSARHQLALGPSQSQLYSYIAPGTNRCWPTRAISGPSSRTRRA